MYKSFFSKLKKLIVNPPVEMYASDVEILTPPCSAHGQDYLVRVCIDCTTASDAARVKADLESYIKRYKLVK